MDVSAAQQVANFLQSCGGAARLGKVAAVFPGVKRSQLSEYFAIIPGASANEDPVVCISPEYATAAQGIEAPLAIANAAVAPMRKRADLTVGLTRPCDALALAGSASLVEDAVEAGRKRRKKISASEAGPLEEAALQHIAAVLTQCGGTLALGKLASMFEGVKKAQLEGHFTLLEVGHGSGQWTVSLPSVVPQAVALAAAAAKPPKKEKKVRDPDAPPPPDLDDSVVHIISEFLQSQGGSVSLGKLSTKFEGIKRLQLEPHFSVVREGATGAFLVSALT